MPLAPSPAPTAGVIVIGDEILSGKFADENAVYLIGALRELGVALRAISVIPDVLDDIADTVRAFSKRYDHVFTSGGVGPTHDDLTMDGVARVRVVRDPQLEQALRVFYGERLEPRHLRMAEVPDGAHFIPADHPSWPITAYRNVYILPGVPSIFRRKFDAMRERFRATPFHVRRVYCLGEEATLAPHLDAIVAAFPDVAVGSYPRFEETAFRVIITLESRDASQAERARDALAARLPGGVVVRSE
jgi:molybdenum cofactor synthesis domain-containing protein